MYSVIETPVQFTLMYTLPAQYGDEKFYMEYMDQKWFIPASAHPSINVSVIAGN